MWASGFGCEGSFAFVFVAGKEFGHPSAGNAITSGCFGLRNLFNVDGGDDQPGFVHVLVEQCLFPMSCDMCFLCPATTHHRDRQRKAPTSVTMSRSGGFHYVITYD